MYCRDGNVTGKITFEVTAGTKLTRHYDNCAPVDAEKFARGNFNLPNIL